MTLQLLEEPRTSIIALRILRVKFYPCSVCASASSSYRVTRHCAVRQYIHCNQSWMLQSVFAVLWNIGINLI